MVAENYNHFFINKLRFLKHTDNNENTAEQLLRGVNFNNRFSRINNQEVLQEFR